MDTNIIDAHIHLEQYDQTQMDRRIEEWMQAGISGVIAVSTDLASSYRTLWLKQRYPDFVFAAIGFHPENQLPPKQDLVEILSLLAMENNQISAIGEVGLPYYNKDPKITAQLGEYVDLLKTFSLASKQCNLPLILHAVHNKTEMALQIVKEIELKKVHFHWLKAPQPVVQRIIDSGYYISVTPEVCFKERDQKLVLSIPECQLLLETDGPWQYDLWPQYIETTPTLIYRSAAKISELKEKKTAAILSQTFRNTLNFIRG